MKVNAIVRAIATKYKHIAIRIVLGLLILFVAAIVCIQIPKVQTAIASALLQDVREKMDGDITFGAVKILPFNTVIVQDVLVSDAHPYEGAFFEPQDTAMYFENIVVSLSVRGLFNHKGVFLRKVTVTGGLISSVKEGVRQPNFNRIFGTTPANYFNPNAAESSFFLNVRKINIRDMRVRLLDPQLVNKKHRDHGIQWMDMEAHANVQIRNFWMNGVNMDGDIADIQIDEKSGYRMLHAEGHASFRQGHAAVREFHMEDPWTHLYLPSFDMLFQRPSDMQYYTDRVRMRGCIKDSKVALKSVGYFGQMMKYSSAVADISELEFDGTVNEMTIKEFRAKEKHGTSVHLSGRIKETEHPEKMIINADLKSLSTSSAAAQRLLYGIYPYVKADMGKYAPGHRMTFKAKVDGNPKKLDCKASMRSDFGNFNVSCLLSQAAANKSQGILARASLTTDNLDLGIILNQDKIRQCTAGTLFTATISNDKADLKLDSLKVDRLNLLDYNYSGIAAAGTYSDNIFNGRIVSSDPNLSFLFQGIFNFSPQTRNALYKFYFNLGYADLNAIHLDKRGKSRASAEVIADYISIESHDIIGSVDVRNLNLENSEGKHKVGDISISSHTNGSEYRINLKSGFADAKFSGDKSIKNFIAALTDLTTRKYLPSVHNSGTPTWNGEKYNFNVTFGDTRGFISFIKPGLYLANGTSLTADIDSAGTITGKLLSQRLAIGKNNIKGVEFGADTRTDSLTVRLTGDEFTIGTIKLLDNKLRISARDDKFKVSYRFDNEDVNSFCDINSSGEISQGEYGRHLRVKLEPSGLSFNGFPWHIEARQFDFDSTGAYIDRFRLADNEQELTLHGGYSRSRIDTMNVTFKDFRLEKAMDMLQSKMNLKGTVNGNLQFASPFRKQVGIALGVRCDSTFIGGHEAGLIKMESERVEDSKETRFTIANDIKGKSTFTAKGSLFPDEKKVAVKVNLDSLCLGYFGGLAKSIFSSLDGTISGQLSAIGPLNKLSVYSQNTRINSGVMKIAFTNVPYYIDGPFHINDNGIVFDNMDVKDENGGVGNVTGGINFNHLHDMRMNTHVTFNNLKALDIDRTAGQPIYGRIAANGAVNITGPFNSLDLNAAVTTSGNGEVGIPLGNSPKIETTDLLVFKENTKVVDPYEEMMKTTDIKRTNTSGLGLNLNLEINPEVQCRLVLDRTTDNAITGFGNGKINIQIPKNASNLNIRGAYTLNDGKFHFTVVGLASRTFEILNGSTVSFTGDIMDSDLNINATYTTKASLGTLLGDNTSGQARSTVNCGIHIYDKLSNPQLKFSIEVPDASAYTQSRLQSLLSTEDKVQRQFLSLIVSNSFLPDDDAGIVNNTNVLLSNAAEIMAGQLSNILKMLNIPLDLGFNYQQDKGGTDIFDVAVSTQLFNNRVLVNGSVGNRKNSQSTQDIVGDLDIEIKINKNGNLRASLFSHSADKYTNYLDDSQRNGLGISYQQEFTTFREFWNNIFNPKKAKAERDAELMKQNDRKVKTIKIDTSKKDERK